MSTYIKTIKQFDSNLRLFYTGTAIHGFVFSGVYALLLNLYLLRLGYGPEFIGMTNGIAPIVLAVVSIPAGQLSRRIGSRKALTIGYFFVAVGFMLLPLSEWVPAGFRESWIVLTYAFAWLSGGLVVVNFGPYLMAATQESQRDHAFAIQAGLFPIFGFLGNLVGGFLPSLFVNLLGLTLESPLPYRNVLFLAGTLYLLAALSIWHTSEVKLAATPPQELRASHSRPPYAILLAVLLFASFIMAGQWAIRIFANVYLDTVFNTPTVMIGAISATAQLLGMVAFMAPWLIGRIGRQRILLYGFIVMACAFTPLILIANWAAVAIGYVALTFAAALTFPAFGVFTQTRVSPEWHTTMGSATVMSQGIGIATISLVGSRVITFGGFQLLFFLGACFILLGAALFWTFFVRKRTSGRAWGEAKGAPTMQPE